MKIFEHVHIRIISKPTDSLDELEKLIRSFIPESIPLDEQQKEIKTQISNFENSDEELQHILELDITKTRHLNLFAKLLLQKFDVRIREILLKQLDSRIDEECNFFFRFDLDDALREQITLTQSGRCVHFKCAVSAFPKRKESAIITVENYLK
jgi:RNA binding exosome subunit